jgi:hypothetical protein
VLHKSLVQVNTSKLVVVSGGEDGVETTSRGDNGNIRAGAAKVGDNNNLILNLGLRTGIVSQNSGNRVGDKLEDLKAGIVGGLDQSLSLLLAEVCGNSNNGRGDLLSEVVGGGSDKSSQISG